MAIYTRTGDQGMTSVRQGERVSKGSLQVAVLGELDELNCQMGFAVAVISSLGFSYREMGDEMRATDLETVVRQIREIQGELLELGAQIANIKLQQTKVSTSGKIESLEKKSGIISQETGVPVANKWIGRTGRFEEWIDGYEQGLPTLQNFILPGGGVGGSSVHVCRAVLRRVERTMVRLVQSNLSGGRQMVPEFALGWLPYLNRLGDWLFVLARWTAWITQENEQIWEGDKK